MQLGSGVGEKRFAAQLTVANQRNNENYNHCDLRLAANKNDT